MNKIQLVPIAKIRVINPRHRSKAKFTEIVENISKLGLKKPITVSRRGPNEDGYDLVCGQGRLEACASLGHVEVPAIVIDVPREERLLMSLVENIARRSPRPIEFVRDIGSLKDRGYTATQIASKIDLSVAYVSGVLRLLNQGELRLVQAVERGDIPVHVAVEIAATDDEGMQRSLAQAYENGMLRGRALSQTRRLIEARKTHGKELRRGPNRKKGDVSTEHLVRTYRRHAEKQKILVKKARLCERRLRFVSTAFAELLGDEDFVTLLRAERLYTLPKYLEERIRDQQA
jgi:ParB family chromosome partitioning protein